LDAIQAASAGYTNLEYDLATGERGSRHVHVDPLLTRLTGAEAALVVNNNAAAVLLMLTALCRGRKVIISRGQLIEIGGGFRIPDVMAQSGAELVEVGTTNRTRVEDYARAVDDEAAAILVAHHSNFKIFGFTEEPPLGGLASLAHDRDLFLLYDQGSGALRDTAAFGLAHEPTVAEGLRAGADLVAFSGDKLLGGPQAGILCGRAELISVLRRHPLARAVRADKLALSALGATLRHYLLDEVDREVPVWRMISRPAASLAAQAEAWAQVLREAGLDADVAPGESTVGGGSLPGATLPTHTVTLGCADVAGIAAALRVHEPAVIGRIAAGRLVLDPRTVLPGQEATLLAAVTACLRALEAKE
jgi:L-seryl-tRNA(Ser) seleniumtransferase